MAGSQGAQAGVRQQGMAGSEGAQAGVRQQGEQQGTAQ